MTYDKETIIRMRQEGYSWRQLDEHFGVNPDAVRGWVRNQEWYKDIKSSNPHVAEEGMAFRRNEQGEYSIDNEFTFDNQQLFSDDDLLRMNNLDPLQFDLLRVRRGKWSVTIKDGQRKWNFQSRIDAAPKNKKELDIDELSERLTFKLEPRQPKPYTPVKSDTYLVIPNFDMHFGNNTLEDYDESLGKTLKILMNEYKEVLIIAGGDQIHNDNHRGTTSSGTVIDKVDMTQAWEDAFDFLDIIIDKALDCAETVRVMYVPGNHDEMTGQTLFKALEKVYRNEDRLQIDSEHRMFKATLLGHNFIGASHGDKSNKNKYPMIYATSFSQLWGMEGVQTREVFVGHLHYESTIDKDGLLIRQAPTRNKADQYHLDNGFAGAHKRFSVVEYDEYEPIAVYYV